MATFRTDDFVLVDYNDQTKALRFDLNRLAASTLSTINFPVAFGTYGSDGELPLCNYDNGDWIGYNRFFAATVAMADASDHEKQMEFDLTGLTPSASRTVIFSDVSSGYIALDTSVVCYDGDVVTYDDNLVTI